MHQRRRKSVPFGEDIMPPEFLDIPWFLPPELDYKNIYKVMKKCDADAKKAKIQKTKAKEAKMEKTSEILKVITKKVSPKKAVKPDVEKK